MLKIADKKLEKLGFFKLKEDTYSIIYVKSIDKADYCVEIFLEGLQTLASYSLPGNLPVGLTAKELATFCRKMKELGLDKR